METPATSGIDLVMPHGLVLKMAFDAVADEVLAQATESLVVLAPTELSAFENAMAIGSGAPGVVKLAVCGAQEWRGTREDEPDALLVCIRHEHLPPEATTCPDVDRYRLWMQIDGQEPVI